MATTETLLDNLVTQRNALADILVTRGLTATHEEKFDTLIPKVSNIHDVLTGTAIMAKVVAGETFYSTDSQTKLTGALGSYIGIPLLRSSVSLAAEIKAIVEDNAGSIYVAFSTYIKKFNKADLSLEATSPTFGGIINALAISEDFSYVYAAGATVFTVKAYNTFDLTLAYTSATYGSVISAMKFKNDYLYVVGTTGIIRKFDYTLATISASAAYGGAVNAIDVSDDGYVYIGGATIFTIKKYDIATLTLQATSASYGGIIYALAVDNILNEIWVGGTSTTNTGKALCYKCSDFTIPQYQSGYMIEDKTIYYGGVIYALTMKVNKIFIGGATSQNILRWETGLNSLTDARMSPMYSGVIKAILCCVNDSDNIYAGGTVAFIVSNYCDVMYRGFINEGFVDGDILT